MTTRVKKLPPISVGYNVVRSLQLEGRIHVPADGCWPISSVRIAKGWGYPNQDDFPQYGNSFLFPPPEPPDLDQKAKKFRIAYYMRTYTPQQVVASLKSLSPVTAAFEITSAWIDPAGGRIPSPQKGDKIVSSHSILIIGVDESRREFIFDSGWGEKWGEDGMGRLPYSYFENRLIDAYSHHLERPSLQEFQGNLRPVMNQFSWGRHIPDEMGSIAHIAELYDASVDEYIGWSIVAERGEWLDVHELFVRPVVRKRGNGRSLIRMLQELAEVRRKPLRFWVSFADVESRSILAKLLRSMGYTLGPTPERWAAYLGVRSDNGKIFSVPPPPSYIPLRPTASSPPNVKEIIASLNIAASLASGAFPEVNTLPKVVANEPKWEYLSKPQTGAETSLVEPDAIIAQVAKVLKPGTKEFELKNSRRFELIEKKVDSVLTPEEEVEFALLQSEILAVTKRHFPLPPFEHDQLLLKTKEGADKSDESPK